MKKLLTTLTLTAGLLGLAMNSANAVVIYEGFDYTAGDSLNTKNGGTGFGANAWTNGNGSSTIQSGSLSFGSLVTSGNSTENASFTSSLRDFNSNISTGSVWFSFLVSPTALGDGNTDIRYGLTGSNGNPLLTTTDFSDNGTPGDASDDSAEWALGRFGPGSDPILLDSNQVINVGQTYFIAMQITFDSNGSNDNVDFWIDPTPGSTAPTAASASYIGSDDSQDYGSLTGLNFFNQVDAGGQFDEIRLGDTYGDVAPIPEPSAAALLLFGLAAFLLVRRRR